eukprot:6187436-Pleurochrysis_carterae.AAC.5
MQAFRRSDLNSLSPKLQAHFPSNRWRLHRLHPRLRLHRFRCRRRPRLRRRRRSVATALPRTRRRRARHARRDSKSRWSAATRRAARQPCTAEVSPRRSAHQQQTADSRPPVSSAPHRVRAARCQQSCVQACWHFGMQAPSSGVRRFHCARQTGQRPHAQSARGGALIGPRGMCARHAARR